MAPNARFSTPVARYRTTSPTPESAYTPPNARPITMNGLMNCHSTPNTLNASTSVIEACGHPDHRLLLPCLLAAVELDLLLQGARLGDRLVDGRACEALLLHDYLALLVVDGDVPVVRDVVRERAAVERLAEHVRLLVLQVPHRRVVRLRGDCPRDAEQRGGRELARHEAHLGERLRRDLRVLLQDLEHQRRIRPDARVDVAELAVDPEVTVELRELPGHERVCDRGRRAPLH